MRAVLLEHDTDEEPVRVEVPTEPVRLLVPADCLLRVVMTRPAPVRVAVPLRVVDPVTEPLRVALPVRVTVRSSPVRVSLPVRVVAPLRVAPPAPFSAILLLRVTPEPVRVEARPA